MQQKIGCFLLVLVLAVLAWDQWRIEQMRNEVRAISERVHVGAKAPQAKASSGGSDLVTSLAQIEKHARRAKELMKQKKTAAAQAELDKLLASLKSANTVSTDIAGDAAEFLGKARDNAVDVFQKAWKDISEEAKPKKVGVEGEGKK